MLPMTTILASIPCSYLDLLYGSMRGYAAIAPRRAGGRGRAQEKGGGKEGEGEMELLQHTTRATPDAPALTCSFEPRAPSFTWVRVLVTESRARSYGTAPFVCSSHKATVRAKTVPSARLTALGPTRCGCIASHTPVLWT